MSIINFAAYPILGIIVALMAFLGGMMCLAVVALWVFCFIMAMFHH